MSFLTRAWRLYRRRGIRGSLEEVLFRLEQGRLLHVHYPPRWVTVNIIGMCNFKCDYCLYHGPDARNQELFYRVSLDEILPQVALLREGGVEHIHLCGTGEPFLHPQIFEMFAAIRASGAKTSVLSNASSVLSDKLGRIAQSELEYFASDLDAVDAGTFLNICGRDDFDAVCSNLRNLAAWKRKTGWPKSIHVNTILRKQILPSLSTMLSLLRELGVDRWSLNELLVPQRETAHLSMDDKLAENREDVSHQLSALQKDVRAHGGPELVIPPFFQNNLAPDSLQCLRPWKTFMLNVPSPVVPQECWLGRAVVGCTESKSFECDLGNIACAGVQGVWNGNPMKAMRASLLNNTNQECREICLCHRSGSCHA